MKTLRQIKEERNLSHAEMYKMIIRGGSEISQRQLIRIIDGRSQPRLKTKKLLQKIFGEIAFKEGHIGRPFIKEVEKD